MGLVVIMVVVVLWGATATAMVDVAVVVVCG